MSAEGGSGDTLKPQKTYDGPGPGRKQCPTCRVYCGVRSALCPACARDFKADDARRKAERAVAERAEAEARRAARAEVEARAENATSSTAGPAAYLVGGGKVDEKRQIVVAHEGRPPAPAPDLSDLDAVRAFARACVAAKPGVYLAVDAIVLWLRAGQRPEVIAAVAEVPGVVVYEGGSS